MMICIDELTELAFITHHTHLAKAKRDYSIGLLSKVAKYYYVVGAENNKNTHLNP